VKSTPVRHNGDDQCLLGDSDTRDVVKSYSGQSKSKSSDSEIDKFKFKSSP